jgi:putative transcriptional regulator
MQRINRIKEMLVIKNKSQKWLSQELGKSANAIALMCNNKTQPHLIDLKKIAELLDVDIRELLVPTKKQYVNTDI